MMMREEEDKCSQKSKKSDLNAKNGKGNGRQKKNERSRSPYMKGK